MIIIKYKVGNEEVTVKEDFLTEIDAGEYIKENLADVNYDEAWFEEVLKEGNGKFNVEETIDKWIWLYSPKKKELFPYGIIKGVSDIFVTIKTKEIQEEEDYGFFRIEKIKDLSNSNKAEFKTDGIFVQNLKEYV